MRTHFVLAFAPPLFRLLDLPAGVSVDWETATLPRPAPGGYKLTCIHTARIMHWTPCWPQPLGEPLSYPTWYHT